MINLIFGPKGAGKTKQIIEAANTASQAAKGDIVFIDKDNRKMYELGRKIRLVDTAEYGVRGEAELALFIKGLLAGNRDIETIFIDGISTITGLSPLDSERLYSEIDTVSTKFNVKFVITVSIEKLPEFLSKYKATQTKVS